MTARQDALPVLSMRPDREPVVYVGRRQDEFWIKGAMTRQRYQITGRGEYLRSADGEPGVDPRDVQLLLKLGKQDFRRVARPQALEPEPAPEEGRGKSEAWDPSLMEDWNRLNANALGDFEQALEALDIPDITALTVKEIEKLEPTHEQAMMMLWTEKTGKRRKGAIDYLTRRINETE